MSLAVVMERGADLFAKCCGHPPRWMVAAPGRVNLIGEHTDYNEGFVLPMAIDRYMLLAGDTNKSREATLHSNTTGETAHFSLRPPLTRGEPAWSNYVRGVVAGFQARGHKFGGFEAVIDSTLPYGGGLASSAALEVSAATLLEAISGHRLDPLDKALLCQKAEHDFAGVPCGIMDQFTSILAEQNHALLLDCRSRTTMPVRMTDSSVTVLIINTNKRHRLAEGEYAKRRAQCETAAKTLGVPALRDTTLEELQTAQKHLEPAVFRRARHVVTENARTLQAARAIQASHWPLVGELMFTSHDSLRDDYEVSCPELDIIVEIARAIPAAEGMIGCRMTGGGFGGCAVSLVHTEAVTAITRKLEQAYEGKTRALPGIFSTRPAAGARVVA